MVYRVGLISKNLLHVARSTSISLFSPQSNLSKPESFSQRLQLSKSKSLGRSPSDPKLLKSSDTSPNFSMLSIHPMELCSRPTHSHSHSHSHSHESPPQRQKICRQWKLGRCYRLPCPFLHPDIPSADDRPSPSASALDPAKMLLCRFWALGKCRYGDSCRFLHTWNVGDCFSFLTALEGHRPPQGNSFSTHHAYFLSFYPPLMIRSSGGIRGIALPSGSDKLYSGSKDKSVRVWDCNTSKCAAVVNVGFEVGCMISAGPCIFVGLVNVVKNIQTYNEILLGGPVGQVHSLATTGFHPPETSGELLFTGQLDGSILVWKFNNGENSFEPTPSLQGHSSNVASLTVGGQRLYSSSLDNTIRVWASIESGNREVTYTHNAEHGVLFLCDTSDLQAKPVLMSAFDDNSVRLYDLPSIQSGPDGLFFTGDGEGVLKVVKWCTPTTTTM
ncbi:hypothetical protein ACLOJK_023187 [Asimina triloba]